MGNISVVPAITRLLEIGAVTTEFLNLNGQDLAAIMNDPGEKLFRYHITPFGRAIMAYVVTQMGVSPQMVAAIEQPKNT